MPERFDGSRLPSRQQFLYLPYSGSPHNRIRAVFGPRETKMILARILQRFELVFTTKIVLQHMEASLEPYPMVMMQNRWRRMARD
jgi:cytochrome P450